MEPTSAARRVFVNRTLNLRAIKAIGCDMDYTLIHYHHDLWEQRAYEHCQARLLAAGWPVADLKFDPEFVTRGLVIDIELGNIVKASRFGFVQRACHGTRMMEHEAQRKAYARVQVDLAEPRWLFLNTLFSLSEACLFAQLVDLLDAGVIKQPNGYRELYAAVKRHLDATHLEGELKQEIASDPDKFVVQDAELPLAILDQKRSGKQMLLITNSEWSYTRAMMSYAFDRHLPKSMTWRDLFDLVVVEARKPAFFTREQPIFEIVDENAGLWRPSVGELKRGGVYLGGHARLIEKYLGVPGEDILYIGDHLYADVHVTKDVLRWRTALIVRELEGELLAMDGFKADQALLTQRMTEKVALEHQVSLRRLALQRLEHGYGDAPALTASKLKTEISEVRAKLLVLDAEIAPLAERAGSLGNNRWGLLLRAGSDKSRMARMIERYSDVYTSRVSNFLNVTPYAYLRPAPGTLPHDF